MRAGCCWLRCWLLAAAAAAATAAAAALLLRAAARCCCYGCDCGCCGCCCLLLNALAVVRSLAGGRTHILYSIDDELQKIIVYSAQHLANDKGDLQERGAPPLEFDPSMVRLLCSRH